MPKTLLLQAGHAPLLGYPAGGGAPDEANWTVRMSEALADHARSYGIEPTIVGNWFGLRPPELVTGRHYDLALWNHYDAAIYGTGRNTGGFADRYRPNGLRAVNREIPALDGGLDRRDQSIAAHNSALKEKYGIVSTIEDRRLRGATDPTVTAIEDHFIATWERIWQANIPIPIRNQRRNPNTYSYYGHYATTKRTPRVLIEYGVGAPVPTGSYPAGDDAWILHNHLDMVAFATIQAVAETLGVPPPAPQPVPEPEPAPEPEEPPVEPIFTDEEINAYCIDMFWDRPFVPGFGIPTAYKQLLREGKNLGRALSDEMPLHDGVYQVFQYGTLFFRHGKWSIVG